MAIFCRIHNVTDHPLISVGCLPGVFRYKEVRSLKLVRQRNKDSIKTYKSEIRLKTLICPSVPVAAATIPVPPLGNLANNFVAYALRIL